MTTNASGVISTLLKDLTGLHIKAGEVEKGLNQIRTAALGAGAVFVGWEVGKGLWHAIENNRELNKELERTKQLGGDFAKNLPQTRAAAFQTSYDAPTSVVADNVRLARELGATVGHPDQVPSMLTEASKAAYVISHYTHENEEDIIKNLVRVADLRGQIYTTGADGKEHVDPAKLIAEFNDAARSLEVGGGMFSSKDLLQFARQAGAVAKAQSPEAFYVDGTEAGIAMGASRLGTAETSLMQQFIGGTMTNKVAKHLTEAGLLHSNEWQSGKSGGVVVNPGVAARFQPMMQDPVAWLSTGEGSQAVKGFAQKEGISVIAAVLELFGRQTAQRLASDAMSNQPQFARAHEIYGNVPSVAAQYAELHNHDLDTNLTEVAAAWKSFMQAFSDAGTPLVIPVLHGLTDGIHELTKITADHPDAVRGIIAVTGGIAGLTVVGGSLVVLNTCWTPLANGLKLLVGVQGLNTAGTAIGAAATSLGSLVTALEPFAVGGAAFLAIAALMGQLHDVAGFGGKNGSFGPATGGPASGAAPGNGYTTRPAGVAPMPGDPDFRIPLPPPSGNQQQGSSGPIPVHVVNGRDLADGVGNAWANQMSRPPTGTSAPDLRMGPLMPGLLGPN